MQGFKSAVVMGVLAVVLVGCGDKQDVQPPVNAPALIGPGSSVTDKAPVESPNDECSSAHWKTLPEGKNRDTLVERCMTRGSYQRSEPQTF